MSPSMTAEECRIATEAMSAQLDRYAELLVKKGAAVQAGQELVLQTPVEAIEFARRVVRAAYDAGAGHVTVIYSDDAMQRFEYENCPLEAFEQTPEWKRLQLDSLAEAGAAFLFLEGSDPNALKGIDPAKPATRQRARNAQCKAFRHGMDFNINQWCIAGVSLPAWAQAVYPDLSAEEATYRLWLAILSTARADGADPQGEWEKHDATFEKNKRLLNGHRFDSLHYSSSNGTDLTVGLPAKHIWGGGSMTTAAGVTFFPNMPTEEVFTTPDRMRASGVVHSAMPLVRAGSIVRNFWFRFEEGKVVDFGAEQGKAVLQQILDTDENAGRLGECAIISKNSPIRESGLLFYNTLFDENASCHLALGTGFPDCYEGGEEMDEKSLEAAGVNHSHTHVDFMIGADDLSITGITADGERIPIMVNGMWAWE